MAIKDAGGELPEREAALKALKASEKENSELTEIEGLLGHFNLFEAIGAVRMEIRHSDFLAFLLDPSQNHGLGDHFLKRFLHKIPSGKDCGLESVKPDHLEEMDLSKSWVRREWENIDILCANDCNQIAVLIENKIDSGERVGQLQEYLDVVQHAYSGFRIIPLFLTPRGDDPFHERYIGVDYSLVCDTLAFVLNGRQSMMGADVSMTITHYIEMLRRHIVSDSEIANLARKIYSQHRQALDLIFEHRPDEQSEWADKLRDMVRAKPHFWLDDCKKAYVRFVPKAWNTIPDLNKGEGWTTTNRILLFVFVNSPPESLELRLMIRPGAAGSEQVRHKLFDASKANCKLFERTPKTLAAGKAKIWSREFLSPKDYEASDRNELVQKVQLHWERFLSAEFPEFIRIVNQLFEPRT